jgi:hypothetical protein
MKDKPKTTHGGARKGAGRKTPNKIEGEVKKRFTIRLYTSQSERLIKTFGSLQKAIDSL